LPQRSAHAGSPTSSTEQIRPMVTIDLQETVVIAITWWRFGGAK